MEDDREKLEKIYQQLNEEEDTILKKWYQSLIPKAVSYTHLTLPTKA